MPKVPPKSQDGDTFEEFLVRLPSDLRERMRQRAELEERTQSQVLRRALRHYLDEVPA